MTNRTQSHTSSRPIWLVEDNDALSTLLAQQLGTLGFATSLFPTGLAFRNAFTAAAPTSKPALVLLDWNLPDDAGDAVCRWIRRRDQSLPLIMLTVRDDPADVVAGLRSGADDYVTKPFDEAVLASRIQALLRRACVDKMTLLSCGDVAYDPTSGVATVAGKPCELAPQETRLLALFLRNKGRLVTRDAIRRETTDPAISSVTDNAISVAVKRLRSKLGPAFNLKTVHSFGYRLEES